MAGRHLLLAAAVLLQIACSQAAVSAPATEGSPADALRVAFAFTGVKLADANSVALGAAVAQAAGVQATAVSGLNIVEATATDDAALQALQASASIEAVNLAAPYAALTVANAADALTAALQPLDAEYVPKSLQVDGPAWVVAAQQSPPQTETASVQFTMTGVALPDLDEIRLSAAIASAAGVRLEQVTVVSVAYAVAATNRRMLTDGYHTLKVAAALDASAAAAAGNILQGAQAPATLAAELQAVLGATLQTGSLQVTTPVANSSGGSSSHLMLGLVIAAAVMLAAALATSGWLTYRYCCAKAATEMSAGKQVDGDGSAVWNHPSYKGLAPGSIVGGKPAPAPPAAAAVQL